MKKINHRLQGILLTIVFSFLFLTLFYSKALFSPNSYLFGEKTDGIKNYYTYAYHVVHDTSFVHFQGMNYPFGELHSFTDGNPLLANSVKLIYKIFPTTKNYLIGIYNLWMLLGFALASIFLYLILFHFTRDFVWSALGGVAIMILSPQWTRITPGHYNLFFLPALPICFYLLLLRYQTSQKQYVVGVALLTFSYYWIHPYIGLITSTAIWGIEFFLWTMKFSKQTFLKTLFLVGTEALLPMLTFWGFLYFGDIHPKDRLENPWGFFQQQATFSSVFFAREGPGSLLNFWNYYLKHAEGDAFIGTFPQWILIFVILYTIYLLLQRKKRLIPNKIVLAFLFSGGISLLISLGIPFNQFPELLEFFPVIKQFRVLARFVWVFYYAMGIFAFIVGLNILKKYKIKYWIGLLIVLLYNWDALPMHRVISRGMIQVPNYFLSDVFHRKYSYPPIKKQEFQAILPLPFFYVGHEHLDHVPLNLPSIEKKTFFLSFHTGLPSFAVYSARTSRSEALLLLKMLSRPDKEKDIKEYLSCNKKILVLVEGKNLNEYEKYYCEKAKVISENLRELQCEILLEKDTSFHPEPKDTVVFLTFDEKETPIKFQGKGAFYTQGKKWNIIKRFQPGKLKPGIYGISLWVYVPDLQNASEFFENIVIETDRWEYLGLNHHIEFAGDWIHLEKTFKIPENFNKKITLFIYEKTKRKKTVILDNLMIWKKQ